MTIQEFSQQLGRKDNPSQLIQGLQALRNSDVAQFHGPNAVGPEWAPWADDEPRAYAQQLELRS